MSFLVIVCVAKLYKCFIYLRYKNVIKCKVADYKINSLKPITFIYTNNKVQEKEIFKNSTQNFFSTTQAFDIQH